MTFRKIHPSDKPQIQLLHEQWFPVKYVDEFYDDLVYERMTSTGDPLFTCVGTTTTTIHGNIHPAHASPTSAAPSSTSSMSMPFDDVDVTVPFSDCVNDCDTNQPQVSYTSTPPTSSYGLESSYPQEQPQQEEIVACVVGCFIKATTLSGHLQKLLVTNHQKHPRLFYIMTVGTTIRNQGIGTLLIEKCIQQVVQDKSCGVLYLHVLTTNNAAIQMYEQLGFHRVIEIPNYYTINSVRHNCYLYAKYYHGNRGHVSSSSSSSSSSWCTVRGYCVNTMSKYIFPNTSGVTKNRKVRRIENDIDCTVNSHSYL